MIDAPKNKPSTAVNVGAQKVAAIYAKAFLAAAEKTDGANELVEELNYFVHAAIDAHPKFEAVFASGLISPDEKSQVLDRVFGTRLAPMLLDFLKVIAQHGRLDIVREIARETSKLHDEHRGRIRVQMATAAPLEDAIATNLSAVLRARKLMREKIKALSSEATTSAFIIGSLPVCVSLLITITTPSYMAIMYTDNRGKLMLLAGFLVEVFGIWVMRRMINFKF